MLNQPIEIPITNREVALRRLGGDAKLYATVAGFFLQDADKLMRELHEAHKTAAFELIIHKAHSLKGLAATFEALPFIQVAGLIESLARDRDLPRLSEALPQLDHEFHRLIANLTPFAPVPAS